MSTKSTWCFRSVTNEKSVDSSSQRSSSEDGKKKTSFWCRVHSEKNSEKKSAFPNKSITCTPKTVRSLDDDDEGIITFSEFSVECESSSLDNKDGLSLKKKHQRGEVFEGDHNNNNNNIIRPTNLGFHEFENMQITSNPPSPDRSKNEQKDDIPRTIELVNNTDVTTTFLPQKLIDLGMYSSAVILLTDERFIIKRIQQLNGNILSASNYHVQDVVQLVRAYSQTKEALNSSNSNTEATSSSAELSMSMSKLSVTNDIADLKKNAVDIYHSFIKIIMKLQLIKDDHEEDAVIANVFYLLGRSLTHDFGWKDEALQLYNMHVLQNILNTDDTTSPTKANTTRNTVTAINVKIFLAIGDIHLEQGYWEEALFMYNNAQSIIVVVEKGQQEQQSCFLELDLLLSSIHLRLGNLYCKQGRMSNALLAYSNANKLLCHLKQTQVLNSTTNNKNKSNTILRQLSYTLHNIGVVRRHMDDLGGALDAYSASISTFDNVEPEEINKEDELRKADTYNNMAGVLRRLTRFGDAFLIYKEALLIKKQYLSDSHPSVSLTLAAMASTLRASGQTQQAMKYYKAALK